MDGGVKISEQRCRMKPRGGYRGRLTRRDLAATELRIEHHVLHMICRYLVVKRTVLFNAVYI
jgi:hypothetical protein